jgi:hypothetical protein
MNLDEITHTCSGKDLLVADFPLLFVGTTMKKSSVVPGAAVTLYNLNNTLVLGSSHSDGSLTIDTCSFWCYFQSV